MGELTVGYEPATGLVRTMCSGFLTVDDVRLWGAELAQASAAARRAVGHVRHLVIATQSPVQSGDVIDAFALIDMHPRDADDGMAVVVSSSLARIQAARNFVSDREKAFTDEGEAAAWLRGDVTAQHR